MNTTSGTVDETVVIAWLLSTFPWIKYVGEKARALPEKIQRRISEIVGHTTITPEKQDEIRELYTQHLYLSQE